MRLKLTAEGRGAYLSLDKAANVDYRLALTHDYHPLVSGISIDFDADGHLVGVEVVDASRQLCDALLEGKPPFVEFAPEEAYGYEGIGFAYLYLDPDKSRYSAETVVVDDERTRGEVNLDVDEHGRLLGIEFLDARDVPAVLLAEARRI